MRIKIFGDGANIEEMYTAYVYGRVQGFTTNPTLMRKAEVSNYELFAKRAIELMPDVPISFEIFSDDFLEMERQARIISSWGKNVYVKIPITNTKGISTIPLIKKLSDDDIKLNITAILTADQVKNVTMSINNYTPSIISVFAGRIADTGRSPIDIMRMSHYHVRMFYNIELLWASTRELYNIVQAEECGCDIITVTPDILRKLPMIGKNLDELSLETVKMFYNDAKEAGYKI